HVLPCYMMEEVQEEEISAPTLPTPGLEAVAANQDFQMVTAGRHIFILAKTDQILSHYLLSDTNITPVEIYQINKELKTQYVNHLATDGNQAIALADANNTIYYISLKDNVLDFDNVQKIESAHNS